MAEREKMSSQNDIGMCLTINVKGIYYETFQDYKKAAMLIAMAKCDWKCLKEQGLDYSLCQNCALAKQKTTSVEISKIFAEYKSNPITKAIIFGGLEPMLQFDEVLSCIEYFRSQGCQDDIVIYTGYYPEEIQDKLDLLIQYDNIIVKFGRFKPGLEEVYDPILGVMLASDNQFARKLS
jgi:pyruvate-formate lyase-activating enzyme